MTELLGACELGKLLDHAFVDRAFERNDQLGEVLHRLPAPVDEFRLMAAAGVGDVDFAVLAGEAHREPLLPLAAIATFPGASGDGSWNVVDQPIADLAELFDRADAGFLIEFAPGRFPGVFTGI